MQPVPVVAVRHSASNMDFQFTHYLGNVHAKCSMEHIALANWFNSEVRSNSQAFLTALSACEQIKNNDEVTLIGSEYTLFIQTLCHRRFHNIWATDPSHWWRDNDKSQQP